VRIGDNEQANIAKYSKYIDVIIVHSEKEDAFTLKVFRSEKSDTFAKVALRASSQSDSSGSRFSTHDSVPLPIDWCGMRMTARIPLGVDRKNQVLSPDYSIGRRTGAAGAT
jgi:hypothetical protein